MSNDMSLEIEVRGKIKGGYRLKVTFTDIRMFVDGFRATESAKNRSGYWIQPPAQLVNGEWKKSVEFDTKTDFWHELESKCVEAIENYSPEQLDKIYEPTDKELSEPINLDDLDIFADDDQPSSPKAIPWMDSKDRRS